MMVACERCWGIYQIRSFGNPNLTYSEVVCEVEASGRICTPEEQCGEMHLVCVKDAIGERCRCGKVRREPNHPGAPESCDAGGQP